MCVQLGVKVGDPQVIAVSDFLFGIDGGQAKRQPPCTLDGFGIDLVHIEGRIGHHIVTASVQIMGVMIERVGLIAGFNETMVPVNRHIHLAELGVLVHLFLAIKRHGGVGLHPGGKVTFKFSDIQHLFLSPSYFFCIIYHSIYILFIEPPGRLFAPTHTPFRHEGSAGTYL